MLTFRKIPKSIGWYVRKYDYNFGTVEINEENICVFSAFLPFKRLSLTEMSDILYKMKQTIVENDEKIIKTRNAKNEKNEKTQKRSKNEESKTIQNEKTTKNEDLKNEKMQKREQNAEKGAATGQKRRKSA